MASRELSILVSAKGALKAARDIGKVDSSVGRLGEHARRGASAAASNLTRLGVVAAGGVAIAVKGGISSLAELEDAITSVDGAIDQVGDGWSTTGQQIATWANEIETSVQRAFDDKEITQAATTLIRFGKISEGNLRPAMEIMTDLAAKTGDVGSASSLLAKALAAPEKAAGRLARVGIILTKEQQDQIKAMVAAGDAAGAQALLLGELEKTTKGAAAAMHGPYKDALLILSDVTEDAQRALGEAFLPVLTKVADKLSNFLADPQNIERIRDFGRGLAGGFEKLLGMADKIPWETIGGSLKIAGAGAKALFDAFTMLPPWVQTAVLTGWGLNKLTGGALGGIVGELGKGLIRGVLGMNAGVVNINAGTVNGGGAGAGGTGGLGMVGGAVATAGIGAAVTGAVLDAQTIATGVQRGYEAGEAGDIQGVVDAQRGILDNMVLLPQGLKDLGGMFFDREQEVINTLNGTLKVNPTGMSPDERQEFNDQKRKLDAQNQRLGTVRAAAIATKASVDTSRQAIVGAERSGASAIVSAIRGIKMSAQITIPVYVNGQRLTTLQQSTFLHRATTLNRFA